jgi:glycine cleavage system aminomethyltransferase T
LLPAHGAEAELSLPKHLADGSAVMTSACWSPLLGRRLGIGFVTARDARPGTTVRLSGGVRAQVARIPFYDPAKSLARRAR